jgi:hypothetical protein
MNQSESESYITTDGQSASLSWNKAPVWGLRPDFYYCQKVAGLFVWSVLSLTRGRVCLYNCCWPSPAQLFSGPSPVGLVTIFYCLRFETSFSSPPTTRRPTVEVFDPASPYESINYVSSFYTLVRTEYRHYLQQFTLLCVYLLLC